MGTEACPFCGHPTKVYADQGNRKHYKPCKLYKEKSDGSVS